MVVDYRALNKLTIKNRFPLPRIDDLLDKLQGGKHFSSLDLMSGYHQTGFSKPFGHYEFQVLPFGLSNAPGTFQHVINRIFGQHKFVLAYMDDILIFSNTAEEHLQHLRMVCETLREHKLYAKLSKCSFMQSQVPFLGHAVGDRGVQVSPAKIEAVQAMPVSSEVFWALPTTFANIYRATLIWQPRFLHCSRPTLHSSGQVTASRHLSVSRWPSQLHLCLPCQVLVCLMRSIATLLVLAWVQCSCRMNGQLLLRAAKCHQLNATMALVSRSCLPQSMLCTCGGAIWRERQSPSPWSPNMRPTLSCKAKPCCLAGRHVGPSSLSVSIIPGNIAQGVLTLLIL